MVSRAPGAAQTPKIDDFWPAQKSCIKHPGLKGFCINALTVSATPRQQGIQGIQGPGPSPNQGQPSGGRWWDGWLPETASNTILTGGLNKKLKYRLKFWWVFGRFPAKLGPRSPLNGPGSKKCAERTYIPPRRWIIMPLRYIFISTIKTKL